MNCDTVKNVYFRVKTLIDKRLVEVGIPSFWNSPKNMTLERSFAVVVVSRSKHTIRKSTLIIATWLSLPVYYWKRIPSYEIFTWESAV